MLIVTKYLSPKMKRIYSGKTVMNIIFQSIMTNNIMIMIMRPRLQANNANRQ